jgi:hypothetical protein
MMPSRFNICRTAVMDLVSRVEITSSRIAERFAGRERSSAPAQILHNNPEILPEADTGSARTTAITGHRRNEPSVTDVHSHATCQ